jgi:hypothetical protein
MEIKKETTVLLTVEEVEKIIKEYLKTKGVDIKNIYFNVGVHNYEYDWNSSMPQYHKLDNIRCVGTEI